VPRGQGVRSGGGARSAGERHVPAPDVETLAESIRYAISLAQARDDGAGEAGLGLRAVVVVKWLWLGWVVLLVLAGIWGFIDEALLGDQSPCGPYCIVAHHGQ
jgi:hypothetical protein